jgi:hypothetical protein
MLSPFDDYPIHPSADPIAHPATSNPNHYDRYWFNGHQRDGSLFFAAAMGHYPVRGVVDAAFSVVHEGVQHSIFASGVMPTDRSTVVGPVRIEVIEPIRRLRYVVEPNEHGIECDLVFEATTVAVEEPRQQTRSEQGVVTMDHTRLTQWGSWNGTIRIDGREHSIVRQAVPGTRDRSWGIRPAGQQVETNWPRSPPQIFWLWAPLHFTDCCTHFALQERSDGSRWLETALLVEHMPDGTVPWSRTGVRECSDIEYDIEWEPATRQMRCATLSFTHPEEGRVRVALERILTFRMRGIGYFHPRWSHGSNHGELETGRESIAVDEFDPLDPSAMHLQNLVVARMGDQTGIGVLEQAHFGPHASTGLTGLFEGHA